MFTRRFLAALLLLAGLQPALGQGQSESLSHDPDAPKPFRATTEESDRHAPSLEATAEAKRLYKIGVNYGVAGLFKQAAETFERAVKLKTRLRNRVLRFGPRLLRAATMGASHRQPGTRSGAETER